MQGAWPMRRLLCFGLALWWAVVTVSTLVLEWKNEGGRWRASTLLAATLSAVTAAALLVVAE